MRSIAGPVAVITDSTASLPRQLAEQWDIGVIQLQLQVGDRFDEENRFGRDEIFALLRDGAQLATSPPDPGAFFWAYQEAASRGAAAVVSMHISGRISETVNVAREAAQQVRIPVHVLDSGTTGMSLGFGALSAARVAAAGGGPDRVIQAAEHRFASSKELIYIDTLEFLRRGGRIGAAQAFLGTALSLKPLLTVKNGEVAPLSRVPGSKRALAKLVDLAVRAAGEGRVDIALNRAGADERDREIGERLFTRLPGLNDNVITDGSLVLGAHLGPNALSITVSSV